MVMLKDVPSTSGSTTTVVSSSDGLHKLPHPPPSSTAEHTPSLISSSSTATATNMTKPNPPSMTPHELAIATLINSLFVGFSMYDVGADLWALQDINARIQFLRTFVEFRANAPIIMQFLGIILISVPFVLYKLFKEDVQGVLAGDKKYRQVHLVGTLNFGCIVGVLSVTVMYILPFINKFIDRLATSEKVSIAMANELLAIHVGQLLFNIFGIFIPFFRWNAIRRLETKIH